MATQAPGGAGARAAPEAIDLLLRTARAHHDAGRLADAETLYRKVLASEPDQPDALHLLGMLAYQVGRHGPALELLDRAVRARTGDAEIHHDRGVVLQALGRLDEALATYRQALALAPAHVDAHYNAGTVLQRQGRVDDAAACYRSALAIAPNLAEAHNNLGTVLKVQGRLSEALECFRRATALQPRTADLQFNLGSALQALGEAEPAMDAYRTAAALDHVSARNELGNLLATQGRLEEAARSYVAALERRPDFAEAHNNLGNVLLEMGALDAALAAYGRALTLADAPLVRANIARALRHPHVDTARADVRALVTRALEEAWARPAELAAVAARVLAADARIAAMLDSVARAWPSRLAADVALAADGLRALGGDRLLRALLTRAPVGDLALERLLTVVREALLARAEADADVDDATLELHAALARQCFVNEYVWPETRSEAERVAALGERLRAAVRQARGAVRPAWLAAVATYRPLASLALGTMVQDAVPPCIQALLVQQISEPEAEARLRVSLPQLTPIEDPVSRRVQSQYEEHPYPRWVALPRRQPATLEALLRQRFARAPLRELPRGADLDILVAGCGTGQEAIETAEEQSQARILAIDLSGASLAYARRMSDARGLRNVEYAQADILQLAGLARRFDVISSVGVLHHLADPMAGWRTLCDLLRPGGVMQIGLYSEPARRAIAVARRHVAQRHYAPTADGIRAAREDLAGDPRFAAVTALRDFHTASECRDLLFHVQEREYTLPQVAELLEQLDLTLLGFVLEPGVVRAYAQRFPDDPAATNVANWARFEADHPETFLGMYVMWLQKTPS